MGEHVVNLVQCPILNKKIDNNLDCFIIASGAEGQLPLDYIPQEVLDVEKWKDICNNCKYNLDRQG
ncbi:MAG: hypothetical protein SPG06_02220 [Eubacteriales bacterium]|nr:hypothetical protein [Eubacteriales bacterium]